MRGGADRIELALVGDELARREQRREGRMHIGIDEGQPAGGFGALARAAVAAEAGLREAVGDIAHDRGVLQQHEVAVDQCGDGAGRIDLEEFRTLQGVLVQQFNLERLAGPLQGDVVGGGTGTGLAVQLHGNSR